MGEVAVIRRALQAKAGTSPEVLDAVVWPETVEGVPGRTLRLFLANPASAAQVAAEQPEGCITVLERREVSGGVMVVGRAPAEGPLRVALLAAAPPKPGPRAAANRATR